jgi:VanZ family protein
VPRLKLFAKYWVPVLLWMAVIYSASGDRKSFQHSSRVIEPIVRWLLPGLTEHRVGQIVFGVRKCAHVTEYAVLAMLVWRALRQPVRHDRRPWKWSEAGLVLLFVAFYAGTDELHQVFVPHRQGSFVDVLLDTFGASLGLLLLWAVARVRKQA